MTPASLFQSLLDYLDTLSNDAAFAMFGAAIICLYLAIKSDQNRTLFAFYAFFAACLMMAAVYIVTG